MATVEAQVCNVALLRIGQLVQISALTDNDRWARACQACFEGSRDAVLEARWWSFARRRAKLARLTAGGAGAFTYGYSLPSDYIGARYIETGAVAPGEGDEIPFEIELDAGATKRVLLSNENTVELVYTAQVTAIGLWSPMARDALAMKVAADLAMSVAKKPAQAEQLMKWWLLFTNAAAAANANQRRSDVPPDSDIVASRS